MPNKTLWAVTIPVLILPPVLLWLKPEMYSPVLAAVLSGVLFGLSRAIGLGQALDRASKVANDRWLPQSESAMHRLMTVLNSIRRFKYELSETCKVASKDLPELNAAENKAIKLLLTSHCRNGGTRLSDIINHLDDAQADWSRFVQANCQGEDCGRIFRAMKQRKNELDAQLAGECGHPDCPQHSPAQMLKLDEEDANRGVKGAEVFAGE
jgi:hypothetical protein